MKISREKLIQIIKEEMDGFNSQFQNDPEEAMMNKRTTERMLEIDAEIARLHAEKESLMINMDASIHTQQQIEKSTLQNKNEGPNE